MGGQLVIGNLFGLLTQMCIPGPEDVGVDLLLVADLLAPLATAIGKCTYVYFIRSAFNFRKKITHNLFTFRHLFGWKPWKTTR